MSCSHRSLLLPTSSIDDIALCTASAIFSNVPSPSAMNRSVPTSISRLIDPVRLPVGPDSPVPFASVAEAGSPFSPFSCPFLFGPSSRAPFASAISWVLRFMFFKVSRSAWSSYKNVAFSSRELGNLTGLLAVGAGPPFFFALAFSCFSFSFLARYSDILPPATMLATSKTPSLSSRLVSSPTSVSMPGPRGTFPIEAAAAGPGPVAPVEATAAGFVGASFVGASPGPGKGVPGGNSSQIGDLLSCSHMSRLSPLDFSLDKSP